MSLEALDRLPHLATRGLAEHLKRDVAHAIVHHQREGHGQELDDVPGELEWDGLIDAGTADHHLHLGPRGTAQPVGGSIGLPVLCRLALDLDDLIAGAYAGSNGRPAGQRCDDGHPAVPLRDLEAHASVVGVGAAPEAEALPCRGIDERRVGVAQVFQNTLDGGLDEAGPIHGIDELLRDVLDDLPEQPRLHVDVGLLSHAALEEPPPRDEGDGQHDRRAKDRSGISHLCSNP